MLQNGRMLCLKSVPTGQSIMEQTSGNIDDDLNIFLSEFVLGRFKLERTSQIRICLK